MSVSIIPLTLIVIFILVVSGYAIQTSLSRHNNRASQFDESRMLAAETLPSLQLTLDETDKWETLAINLLHNNRELSAIELVQKNTGLDFEEARVKLYKLEDADAE